MSTLLALMNCKSQCESCGVVMWFDVPDAGLASSHEGSWEAGLRGAVRPLCTEQPMQAQARLFRFVRQRHC